MEVSFSLNCNIGPQHIIQGRSVRVYVNERMSGLLPLQASHKEEICRDRAVCYGREMEGGGGKELLHIWREYDFYWRKRNLVASWLKIVHENGR